MDALLVEGVGHRINPSVVISGYPAQRMGYSIENQQSLLADEARYNAILIMSLRFLFVFLLFASASAFAADTGDTPNAATLRMDFYYGGVHIADTTDVLTFSSDGAYHIKSHATAIGLAKVLHGDVIIESNGVVDDDIGLRMTAYYEQRGRRKEQRAALATDGSLLRLQRGDETREEEATGAVFDYLTSVYRSYVKGAAVGGALMVTNGWRLREYEYEVVGEEKVQTGMGEVDAVLLRRESDRGERKVWLAPNLDYLPVRWYVDDKGHEFETIVREAIVNGK